MLNIVHIFSYFTLATSALYSQSADMNNLTTRCQNKHIQNKIASLPGGMDEERVSAMSASMLSLGERIGMELARGTIDRIFVEGNKGFGILTGCGQDAVLLVLASESAKQGLLMLEIKRVLAELKLIVQ